MSENLKYFIADPAGNITLFVLSPVAQADYGPVSDYLWELHPEVEQIGFIRPGSVEAADNGGLPVMEMSGLEFCGNASRAFGYYIAKKRQEAGLDLTWDTDQDGRRLAKLQVQVSGAEKPLDIWADIEGGWSQADMPLPFDSEEVTIPLSDADFPEVKGTLVWMPGIAHLVVRDVPATEERYLQIKEWIYANKQDPAAGKDLPAFGVMFYDTVTEKLTPVVSLQGTDRLYFEGSCASGSTCTGYALALAALADEGDNRYNFVQPAGELNVRIVKEGDQIRHILLSGSIAYDDVKEVPYPA